MASACDETLSATTPPYDGSEHEDVQLFDGLLSDSASPETNGLDYLLSPVTAPQSYGCDGDDDSDPGSIALTNLASKTTQDAMEAVRVKQFKFKNGLKKVSENKSAIVARQNRMKRKKYIEGLESSVKKLRKENDEYKSKIDALQDAVDSLSEDAAYLKGVLQNQSDLVKILKAVSAVPGISVNPSINCVNPTSSNILKKSSDDKDPTRKDKDNNYGICLNIQNGSVSFELCSHCNTFSSLRSSSTSKNQ